MDCRIVIAQTDEDFIKAKRVILAYADFLQADLSFQNFNYELDNLNVMYAMPRGCMLLLEYSEVVVGAVGLRCFTDGSAEMKRMFVYPEYQGLGLGDKLMTAFIAIARERGYASIKLDTIPELDKAVSLYKKYQFVAIDPYRYNPHPQALFYELKL
jgi:ribosomal protein S18 acetylase RimI-like enzyme